MRTAVKSDRGRRTRAFNASVIAVACLLVAGIATCLLRPWQRYYACGHSRDYLNELNLISRHSHCCTSGAMLTELDMIYLAQEAYALDHGEYATTLAELELDEPADAGTFHLRSDGKTWSIAVPKRGKFAGNYLLTSDGKLHFSPTAAATEADVVLRDFSR